MRRFTFWSMPALLAGTVIAWGIMGTAAQAGHTLSASPTGSGSHPAQINAAKKLVNTVIHGTFSGATVGSGFQAIDTPFTFSCPGTTTCTYEVDENVQVGTSTSGNAWAICAVIDGNYMSEPNCPYLGYIPNDGFFYGGSFAQSIHGISPGNHTLSTQIYSANGLTIDNYALIYHVYKN